jgi:hypothetical protein
MKLDRSKTLFELLMRSANCKGDIIDHRVKMLDIPPQTFGPTVTRKIKARHGIDCISQVVREVEVTAPMLTHAMHHENDARAPLRFPVGSKVRHLKELRLFGCTPEGRPLGRPTGR